jgi:transposase-like protein
MENMRTLQEAIIHFADFENCRKLMVQLRWPDGIVKCPCCGSAKVTYLGRSRVWKCYSGHKKPTFSLKTGTIFEDSPLGLDKWLAALWLLVNCKHGISSCEVARGLSITQKSAWFMMHRLRFALKAGGLLSGEAEADETFVGGTVRPH